MILLKQKRVRKWAQKCWWDGFRAGVGGMGHSTGQLYEGPRWWQDVLDIAYNAGADHAAELIAKRAARPTFPERDIPAEVLAACYAAASR